MRWLSVCAEYNDFNGPPTRDPRGCSRVAAKIPPVQSITIVGPASQVRNRPVASRKSGSIVAFDTQRFTPTTAAGRNGF